MNRSNFNYIVILLFSFTSINAWSQTSSDALSRWLPLAKEAEEHKSDEVLKDKAPVKNEKEAKKLEEKDKKKHKGKDKKKKK